ncbi:probable DNA-3-methyladenine glycosylase [Coccomyxa sp. Obi]|nr:probable DNA-3-methyladenine glycosylase [Coccomyxa sp. Obi]
MDRLRRRKAVGADMRTESEPSIEDNQEGRILRSRSGRKIPEKTLADAVAQSAKLETRGLGKRPAALEDMSNGAGVTPARVKTGRKPVARATKSQGLEESAALADSDEPLLIGQQLHPHIQQSASCSRALFPVWTQEDLQKASQHLCAVDPLLAPLIKEHGVPDKLLPTATDSAFHGLAHIIIDQQLSVFAARSIANRVLAACGGGEVLEPAAILKVAPTELRACGLSQAKVNYIMDLAQRFDSRQLTTEAIVALDDEALYTELTAVKGIGKWSVDMFAMFHAGRPDILPIGDLAVRKGFQALYKLKAIPTDVQMAEIAEKWRPYRSLGSYYMWRVPTTKSPSLKKSKSAPVGVTL